MKKNTDEIKNKKAGIMAISRKDILNTKERIKEAEYTSETLSRSKVYRMKEPEIPVAPKRERMQSTPYTLRKRTRRVRRPFLVVLLVVVVGSLVYGSGVLFERAQVVVNQKHQTFPLAQEQFTASKDPATPLHFEIMIVPDTEYKDMTLTESENVSIKATGTLQFYNVYSTKAQTIAAHTYVSDSNGKTYLTDKSLTIPGYTTSKTDKTQITPGSASVTVTAFLPGDSYNSNSTDFTINAYRNTSKAKKIYAKATTILSGGAQGLIYTLSPEQKGQLDTESTTTFRDNLLKKVQAQVPSGYVLYTGALQFTSNLDENFNSPSPNAKVPIDGTVTAVIFKEADIANALVADLLPQATGLEKSEIQLQDADALTFAFSQSSQIVTKDTTSIAFTLSGNLHANWNPDLSTLTTSLVGAPSRSVSSIFKTDPGIVSARVSIFPPWQSHLPYQPSKIHIRVE